MRTCNIAVLPGDGIGKEIMPHALPILRAAAAATGCQLATESFPWGGEYYLETGVVMPDDGVDTLKRFDAILFVAAGHPQVDDYLPQWKFVFVMRKQFDQYACLRPVKSWEGVPTLLARPHGPIDFVIVRENSEGEYAGPGGTVHTGLENELALQASIFTRHGVTRIARFAFELARTRRKRVTNVTKSNAMLHGLVFWDKIVEEVRADYPDVEYEMLLVDAAAMKFIQKPDWFDVIVTTNQFGDILSDLGGAMVGSIGLSPSGNINPERRFPSMFEPIHGSAPDIAGQGIANPIGTILSGAIMFAHLGEQAAADLVYHAVAEVLRAGLKTRDLGGDVSTAAMAEAIGARIGA